jgi:uncharacterized protein (TIGR03083 family)
MKMPEPILTGDLFAPIHTELITLLRGLTAEEWLLPTAAPGWDVRDVAAHLLDTAIRRLSYQRDGYARPLPADAFANGLTGFVNDINATGVTFFRRLSTTILVDMHDRYGDQFAGFMASLDPHSPGQWGVSWAGEEQSPMWFDVARELTERWHHQQQIRDAVGRAPLYDRYLAPVLATFARALPYTYRDVGAPSGTTVTLQITGEGIGTFTIVREGDAWKLHIGAPASPTTTVSLRGDKAWRLFTKQRIDPEARIEGEPDYAEALLRMVSIIG